MTAAPSAPAAPPPGSSTPRPLFALALLLGGFFAGPVGWFVQLTANYALTAKACYPGDAPVRLPAFGWDRPAAWLINILAMVLALAGAALSYRTWREAAGGAAGEADAALRVRRRSRFLALWGLMSGLGFLAAVLFNAVALAMVPQCSG